MSAPVSNHGGLPGNWELLYPSKYLRASDVTELFGGGANMTISHVARERVLRPKGGEFVVAPVVYFEEVDKLCESKKMERKRLILVKTNSRLIAEATGLSNPREWTGCIVHVYVNPKIRTQEGVRPGVRIKKEQ